MPRENNNNKKYPKSINNFECLGPCYEKNTSILHPTRFRTTTSVDNFCPTTEHMGEDPITGKPIKMYTDRCLNPTHTKDELSANSLLAPRSEFSKEFFLAIYYEITSFEQCMEWLSQNTYVPLKTQIRVVNASLNVFGNNLQLIDDRFVTFFSEYIKKFEMPRIYAKIHKYIGIKNDQILLVESEHNSLKKEDNQIERINYIMVKFLKSDDMQNFLLKYMNAFEGWDTVNDNLEKIVLSFIEYIFKKITVSN